MAIFPILNDEQMSNRVGVKHLPGFIFPSILGESKIMTPVMDESSLLPEIVAVKSITFLETNMFPLKVVGKLVAWRVSLYPPYLEDHPS